MASTPTYTSNSGQFENKRTLIVIFAQHINRHGSIKVLESITIVKNIRGAVERKGKRLSKVKYRRSLKPNA